jgi:hypothetical protein
VELAAAVTAEQTVAEAAPMEALTLEAVVVDLDLPDTAEPVDLVL